MERVWVRYRDGTGLFYGLAIQKCQEYGQQVARARKIFWSKSIISCVCHRSADPSVHFEGPFAHFEDLFVRFEDPSVRSSAVAAPFDLGWVCL